jgi:hypothetical protein
LAFPTVRDGAAARLRAAAASPALASIGVRAFWFIALMFGLVWSGLSW